MKRDTVDWTSYIRTELEMAKAERAYEILRDEIAAIPNPHERLAAAQRWQHVYETYGFQWKWQCVDLMKVIRDSVA